MAWLSNARMYSQNRSAGAAWVTLLARAAKDADVPLEPFDYPAPQPLEEMWERPDLGLVFMCGFPRKKYFPQTIPVAAPVPTRWGRPVYCSDLIVRADSPIRTLEDSFGRRMAWTVHHSQSGCNAPRHHLLKIGGGKHLYSENVGPLISAAAVVKAVIEGAADIGPLDAYVHELMKIHAPEQAALIRTVDSTPPMPIPLLVAAPGFPDEYVQRLRAALLAVGPVPELALDGFAVPEDASYDAMLAMEEEALMAGYELPA
jgi:ABC-type phosphate/phosphonate transport system substrate-binding protein